MFDRALPGRGIAGTLAAAVTLAAPGAAMPAGGATAAGGADCRPAQVTEVAAGVFVRRGHHAVVFERAEVANVGFVVGGRCVAVIDTGGSLAEGRALRCALGRITALPVCYVINTHVHPDHILGNLAFRQPGVRFVGHTRLRRALALQGGIYLRRAGESAGHPLGAEHIVAPDMEVDRRLALDLGARTLHLQAHSRAHTDHDLTVFDAQTATLWLGDLVFMHHVPVIDGSVTGWQDVLERLSGVDARRAVPGHGPASAPWPVAARDTLRYLKVLSDETRAWLQRGGDLQGAQDTLGRSERGHWRLFDAYHQRNIAAAVTELEWED